VLEERIPAAVSTRAEIREFLVSRRARISPKRLGLDVDTSRRRVPGLRREEVALLAGVSVDYYIQLERGDVAGASDLVLDAVADALRLDEAERVHLRDLVRSTRSACRGRRRSYPEQIRPSVGRLLDAITEAPATLRNARMDILAANRLGMALHAPAIGDRGLPAEHARFFFLDPYATEFYPDWEAMADRAVAVLRSEASRYPEDRELSALIDDLSRDSEPFARRWEAHDVSFYGVATEIRFRHPVAGELELTFEAMPVVGQAGLWLMVLPAKPGSSSERALARLRETTAAGSDRDRGTGGTGVISDSRHQPAVW
jgi:transcriptional regulator with XRE-family HTH domain